jgi:APA family basic amino acid/polyamine antiporter
MYNWRMPNEHGAAHEGFIAAMTVTDATLLAVGSMIGSGIFIVSAGIARAVGSPAALLGAWVLTGVITILGALAVGEMASMYPRAGGQYVFLREAFGTFPAFLYGWTLLTVIHSGTIAAVAVAFGRARDSVRWCSAVTAARTRSSSGSRRSDWWRCASCGC